MATKIISLDPKSSKLIRKPTPIEFVRYLFDEDTIRDAEGDSFKPEDFAHIELICLGYCNDYDLMFAYKNPNNRGDSGCLFIGRWNDGVIK